MSHLKILLTAVTVSLLLVSCSKAPDITESNDERESAARIVAGLVDKDTGLVHARSEMGKAPADLVETWQLRQLAGQLDLGVPDLNEEAVAGAAKEANGIEYTAAAILVGSQAPAAATATLDELDRLSIAERELLPAPEEVGFALKILEAETVLQSVPAGVRQSAEKTIKEARPEDVCGSAYLVLGLRTHGADLAHKCSEIGVSGEDSTRRALDLASLKIGGFRQLSQAETSFLKDSFAQLESIPTSDLQSADLEAAYRISQAIPELKSRASSLVRDCLKRRLDSRTGMSMPVVSPSQAIEDTYQAALLLGKSLSFLKSPKLDGTLANRFDEFDKARDEIGMQKVIFIKRELGDDIDLLVSRYSEVRSDVPKVLTHSNVGEWATILDLNRKIGLDIVKPELEMWSPTTDFDKYNSVVAVYYSDLFANSSEIRDDYSQVVDSMLESFDAFSGPTEDIVVALKATNVAGSTSSARRSEIIDSLQSDSGCSWGKPFLAAGYKTDTPADTECSLKDTASLRFAGGLPW